MVYGNLFHLMPTQNKISNDALVTVAGGAAMLGWLVLRREPLRGSSNKAATLTCRSQAGSGYMGDKPRRCRSDLRPKPTHLPILKAVWEPERSKLDKLK